MKADIVFAPEVADDLGESYQWYESCRPGLGEEFLNCVEASLEQIRRMPQTSSPLHGTYRRRLTRRFPFAIFYDYDSKQIVVYAIFHASRHPDKWKERLP